MERDFELEYKTLKQNETPDLWNRIEAGLPEKKIATAPFVERNQDAYLARFRVKKQSAWKRFGILAAACLCVVIVFPAVIISITDSSKSGSSADTALYEESADGFAGGMEAESDMAAAEDAAVSEDAAAAEDVAESKDTAASRELTDGQVLEDTVVQILSADQAGEKDIYTVIVQEPDTDGVLAEDMQIYIICDADSEYGFPREARDETSLKEGKSYTVTLRYEESYGQDESIDNGKNPVFYTLYANVSEA